jgi:hypothetical protein
VKIRRKCVGKHRGRAPWWHLVHNDELIELTAKPDPKGARELSHSTEQKKVIQTSPRCSWTHEQVRRNRPIRKNSPNVATALLENFTPISLSSRQQSNLPVMCLKEAF